MVRPLRKPLFMRVFPEPRLLVVGSLKKILHFSMKKSIPFLLLSVLDGSMGFIGPEMRHINKSTFRGPRKSNEKEYLRQNFLYKCLDICNQKNKVLNKVPLRAPRAISNIISCSLVPLSNMYVIKTDFFTYLYSIINYIGHV